MKLRYLGVALFAFLVLPIFNCGFGLVQEVDNPYSDVDRGVRMVAVIEGRMPLTMDFFEYRMPVSLPFFGVSDEDRHSDLVGHGLAANRAAELAGVWLEQVLDQDIRVLNSPPLPDDSNTTGWSSTAAAFSEWYLFSTGRCLDEVTVITAVAVSDTLEPIAGVNYKYEAAIDYGAEKFVVAKEQSDIVPSSIPIIYISDVHSLADYLESSSHIC